MMTDGLALLRPLWCNPSKSQTPPRRVLQCRYTNCIAKPEVSNRCGYSNYSKEIHDESNNAVYDWNCRKGRVHPGGAGNQWTTIGGVHYCTFWDIRTRDWAENENVTFTCGERQLWENSGKFLTAWDITKCVELITVVEISD